MKQAIKYIVSSFGYEVKKKNKEQPQIVKEVITTDKLKDGLRRIHNKNFEVNTIIDVGAAAGCWTGLAKNYWPSANYILIEPLEERKDELEELVIANQNHFLVSAVAGKEDGVVKFKVAEDLDGSGVIDSNQDGATIRELKVIAIENEVKRLGVKGPYIIKLDTHGFEVPIIEGCTTMLSEVNLFIIECYGFQLTKDSLLFWEMCSYMENLGFRLFDVVDIMRRPNDDAFWQCDAFFIPAKTELFNNNSYR